jgi:hypothetical protein
MEKMAIRQKNRLFENEKRLFGKASKEQARIIILPKNSGRK